MIIIYTIDDAGFEQQGLAYSTDGETYHQYENNPIIANPNIRDFRFVLFCACFGQQSTVIRLIALLCTPQRSERVLVYRYFGRSVLRPGVGRWRSRPVLQFNKPDRLGISE